MVLLFSLNDIRYLQRRLAIASRLLIVFAYLLDELVMIVIFGDFGHFCCLEVFCHIFEQSNDIISKVDAGLEVKDYHLMSRIIFFAFLYLSPKDI